MRLVRVESAYTITPGVLGETMASQQVVEQFQKVVEDLKSVDKDRLLRPSLGEESLEQAGFASVLTDTIKKASFALQYASNLDDGVVQNVSNSFSNLFSQLDTQAKRANTDYVSQRTGFTSTFMSTAQQVRQFWTHFISAAIE